MPRGFCLGGRRGKGRESPGQWSSTLTFAQSLGDQAPALEMQILWVWLSPGHVGVRTPPQGQEYFFFFF